MEPFKFSAADGHGSSSSSDPLDAELSQRLALPYLLISETSLLSDIQQRQRKWVVVSEEIIDSHQTIVLALTRYLLTEEGVKMSVKRDRDRAEFLARGRLQPSPVLRVIDIQAKCQIRTVVLMDYRHGEVLKVGFSAISHTYGMEVYDIFNCQCTTKVSSVYMNPRCLVGPCPHDSTVSVERSRTRDRVVNDILGMCENLCKAGVEYAWHDGVCICQHDDAEVMEMIKCMGWVYAYAKETIIFLHYVGKPMEPIGPGDGVNELICRWHTRVWTLQEGAWSNERRYCVRVGDTANFKRLQHCQSLEEYEKEVGLWYKEEYL
ncbi:hypothetical protein L7F22_039807 [Adiantum nelumboides]|nr:hypothetical protein [Adiantum nelumboides]